MDHFRLRARKALNPHVPDPQAPSEEAAAKDPRTSPGCTGRAPRRRLPARAAAAERGSRPGPRRAAPRRAVADPYAAGGGAAVPPGHAGGVGRRHRPQHRLRAGGPAHGRTRPARAAVAPHVADFDSYVFELSDPASELYAARADLVACVLDATVVFDEVPVVWQPEDVERVLADKLALLAKLAATFRAGGHGTLVFNTLPLPRERMAELVGHRPRRGSAPSGGRPTPGCCGWWRTTRRWRSWTWSRWWAPAYRCATPGWARTPGPSLAGAARAVRPGAGPPGARVSGRAKKALVLDLDNTTWGGVLGDDGIEGIEVAGGYRGRRSAPCSARRSNSPPRACCWPPSARTTWSRSSRCCASTGDDAARGGLRTGRRQLGPKHENLRALAADLNVGVDSFVFADDSAYECGLVRRELPEVAVVHLDGDPALHVGRVLADGWFDVPDITTDDLKRPERYRQELVRKDFLDSFSSLEDYLRELDVTVELAPARPADLARVSQITLRTNQFNLTTRRLRPAEVEALADSPTRMCSPSAPLTGSATTGWSGRCS
ncbi:hypothetical protein NKH77_47610 [Streptomyces sp. M19]